MDDPFNGQETAISIIPGRRLEGTVSGVYVATGDDFISTAVDALDLGFDGIADDFHAGLTRKAGGREPWYPRGTEMRNERQVTVVAADELAEAADAMDIDRIAPEWIGANIVVDGIARLSMLPPRTLIFFAGGATLKVDGQNGPCRLSGRAIADHYPDRDHTALALSFKDAAKRRRGLVAWVEKTGRVAAGEAVTVKIPEQWVYR